MLTRVSFHYYRKLVERSKDFLKSAEENLEGGRYDVAALEAEISAQLLVKALLVKLGVEPPRTHGVRTLLSRLASELELEGLGDELRAFSKKYRKELMILEDSREIGQYGLGVDEERARISVEVCEKLHDLLGGLAEE